MTAIFIDCILLLLILCIIAIFAILLYPVTSLIKVIFYKNKTMVLENQFKDLAQRLGLKSLTIKREGSKCYIDFFNSGGDFQIVIPDKNLKEHLSLSLKYSLGFDELARKQALLMQANYKEEEIDSVINTIRIFILNSPHLQLMDMKLVYLNQSLSIHYIGSTWQQYVNVYKRTLSSKDYVPYFVLDWTREKDD